MFHAWFHLDTLHKNSITIFYVLAKIYRVHIQFNLNVFFLFYFFFSKSRSNKTFPVTLKSTCNITRFPSLYRTQFIERVATLPSPILGCIANDSSSTRKIIFDWAARALELGRKQAPLPLPPRDW